MLCESHYNRLDEAILMSTYNIPFSISIKKIILNDLKSPAMGFFSKGLKNEYEISMGTASQQRSNH